MDWTGSVDIYCERTGPEFWSEPVNALTNAAFLVAALVLALRLRGAGLPVAWVLVALLAAIGVGSFLFHTAATPWAGMLDVAPVAVFVLVYLYAANRAYLGWPVWAALLGMLAFPPVAAGLAPAIRPLPVIGVSAIYWPVALLIALYAALLWRRLPVTARGLALGAGVLTLSLLARSLDGPLCEALPMGTHFLWHLLNAVMLGWMIEVYRAHMLAARAGGG